MKTHDELWDENMVLLEPTTMSKMDKDYVCGILTRKDAMQEFTSAQLDMANQVNMGPFHFEKVKIMEETA